MNRAPKSSTKPTLEAFMSRLFQHLLLLACVAAILTGCEATSFIHRAPIVSVDGAPGAIRGTAFGGQQPIVGASLQLYAANLTGYGSASQPLLPANTITTVANGSYDITGQYTCPTPDAPVYLVAAGGSTGGSAANPNLTEMVALGSCNALQSNASTTVARINEVTTVAAAYALAPFMTGVADMGTSPSNETGLNFAFADVNQLVDNATGRSPGTDLPQGAKLQLAKLNALANSLAACVNSTGGTAGDNSSCGTLFTAATPPGGSAPTDIVSAVINIVQHPGQNVATIYALAAGNVAFRPTLTAMPNDWTLAVTYTGGGLSAPSAVAVDADGNVWITNRGANTVTELANSGEVLATSPAVLSAPAAVALDATGDPWIANATADTLTHLSNSAAVMGSASGGLDIPSALAIDPQGNLWVSNSGTGSVSEFTSTGSPLSGNGFYSSGITNPLGIAISTSCSHTSACKLE
ncbi:MAG: hypothetical protein HIU91_05530 [Acidobacteria bacterium]|nr:hypothetical protein [Acidobacteriota bacterium]